MDSGMFDSIVPSRYVSFDLPKPLNPRLKYYLQTPQIRIAILDSQSKPTNHPIVVAMLVPRGREDDWIFSTEAGHSQLLSGAPEASRLILIGNDPHSSNSRFRNYTRSVDDDLERLEGLVRPLLAEFLPKKNRELARFDTPFLRYEDNVISSVVLERLVGPVVGEMLVEDVEIEGAEREFRRRLRFKRMPNLVQSAIRIAPIVNYDLGSLSLKELGFRPDLRVLVHPYLAPMVASVSLIGGYLQECHDSGIRPRALCIGVGGGALPGFLANQLGFEVIGLDVDEMVLRVAREYFGLEQCELVQVSVGDGIETLKNIAADCPGANFDAGGRKFDVIMVDLDPSDFRKGTGTPPSEFVEESVFSAAKSCLSGHGLLVVNVMPTESWTYESLIEKLGEVFMEIYEIDSENEENFVVISTMSRTDVSAGTNETAFLMKLRSVISEAFVDAIRKL